MWGSQLGNPSNLQYSSAFNYQKISKQGTVNVIVPPGITSTTQLTAVPVDTTGNITYRTFIGYNNEVQATSYLGAFVGSVDAKLYTYTENGFLYLAADESGTGGSIIFYYRIYLDLI